MLMEMSTSTKQQLRRRAERGATATLVAVVLAGGVLLGAGALALDVGNMMFERRQLQNGADAAAFKLAEICDEDVAQCSDTLASTQSALVSAMSANAADAAAALNPRTFAPNGMCGRVAGSSLPACPSDSGDADVTDLTVCPPLPGWLKDNTDIDYVETYSLTETSDGSNVLDNILATGPGTAVSACARVAWGAGGIGLLPLTFGQCEWARAVGVTIGSDGEFIGTPSFPTPEIALGTNYDAKDATCANFNGHDYEGGFGWLDHPTGVCEVSPDADSWVAGWPGNGTGNDCLPNVHAGDFIFIPIYDCINGEQILCADNEAPAKTYYHIKGMALFEVTAIDLTGKTEGTPGVAAKDDCALQTNNKQCIYGKFHKELVAFGDIDITGGTDDYGLTVVKQVG
jgi:hypothetical protein